MNYTIKSKTFTERKNDILDFDDEGKSYHHISRILKHQSLTSEWLNHTVEQYGKLVKDLEYQLGEAIYIIKGQDKEISLLKSKIGENEVWIL